MSKHKISELIYTKAYLALETPVSKILDFLKEHNLSYVPITDGQQILGMANLFKIQNVLSSQFGWALIAHKAIPKDLLTKPLIFHADGKPFELMKKVVGRPSDSIYDDVIIEANGSYLGLVSVRQLMIYQVKFLEKQMDKMLQQQHLLKKTISTYLIDHKNNEEGKEETIQTVLKTAQKLEYLENKNKKHEVENEKLSGQLDHFSCTDLVQLLVQGKKTGLLSLQNDDQNPENQFKIYFFEGKIVHAEGGIEIGKYALWSALTLSKGNFTFIYDEKSPIRTIDEDPLFLLIEGCRIQDEANALNS